MAKRIGEIIPTSKKNTHITWEKFQEVCELMARNGMKRESCTAIGLNYNGVMSAIRRQKNQGDMEWESLWDESYHAFKESLEAEIIRRGRDGLWTPVWYKGEQVGEIKTYSDRLLELAAKRHMPNEYAEQHRVSGSITTETVNRPGIDVLSRLSPMAKKRVRDIIIQDLRDQEAESLRNQSPVQDAEFTTIEDKRSDA